MDIIANCYLGNIDEEISSIYFVNSTNGYYLNSNILTHCNIYYYCCCRVIINSYINLATTIIVNSDVGHFHYIINFGIIVVKNVMDVTYPIDVRNFMGVRCFMDAKYVKDVRYFIEVRCFKDVISYFMDVRYFKDARYFKLVAYSMDVAYSMKVKYSMNVEYLKDARGFIGVRYLDLTIINDSYYKLDGKCKDYMGNKFIRFLSIYLATNSLEIYRFLL